MDTQLGKHYQNFIHQAVVSGRFNSSADVMRKAILLLEQEEMKISLLRQELETGELSPMIENFDSKTFLTQIHENYL